MACRMRMTVVCVEQDDWICRGPRAGICGWRGWQGTGSAVRYEMVAGAAATWSGPVAGWR
jgi:hypothetical protein